MVGLGAVGLALSAVSTISSLIESAAASLDKAPAAAKTGAPGATQLFSAPAAKGPAVADAKPLEPGVVVPKFDERTQAALIALQEQHRGG